MITYAVAQRDSTFQTLLRADDIEYLAPWIEPSILLDSAALRDFVIGALHVTCFIGCDVQQVRRRADVPDADSPFLRSETLGDWRVPRTYSWQSGGSTLVEFAVHSAEGVYAVRVDVPGRGRLLVSISRVARYMLL
ncbi:MAG TPA: hypothetical protein VFK13_08265 [Gemmatimonadaceae bacterium]|nr:hypothetical protein [Gemmatimonadaceae bacterium]